MGQHDYSIRSLCYAHVDHPAEFFGGVPIHSERGRVTAAMQYLLLSHQDEEGAVHHHLVDVGFVEQSWIRRHGFYDYQPPEQVLARVGLVPDDIESVILTHMHFDHMNAVTHYPNAEVYLQRAEYEGWRDVLALPERFFPMGEDSFLISSFHRDDLALVERLEAEGKLHFLDGDIELLPGVTARLSRGGHSFGLQWLTVETAEGPYVLASDAAMWYSNLEQMWPSGYTGGSTYQMVLTYGDILDVVDGSLDRVVPAHDMRIYETFPSWKDGTNEVGEVRIAAWDRSAMPRQDGDATSSTNGNGAGEAACPHLRDYDPFEPGHLADPYPIWDRMLREQPVSFVQNAGFWAVTRYADVMQVIRDTEAFTSRDALNFKPVPEALAARLPKGFPQSEPSLINSDPPKHATIRKIANRALTPRRVAERSDDIARIADGLIDNFAATGTVDIIGSFGIPLPVRVIAEIIGVEPDDQDDFKRWSTDAIVLSNPTLSEEDFLRCSTSMAELKEYLDAKIEQRLAEPRDDLLSALVHEGDDDESLSREQIVSITAQLLIGGNFTTTDLIGNVLLVLLQEPERFDALRSRPEAIPNVIEEVLRLKSSVRGLFRTTTRDVEVGGTKIPKDSMVWVLYAAANHDPSVFPDPDRFDPDRENLAQHLSFSKGTHFCIGAPLARLEARLALEAIVRRLPGLRLVEDQELIYTPSPVGQGVEGLLVTWEQ